MRQFLWGTVLAAIFEVTSSTLAAQWIVAAEDLIPECSLMTREMAQETLGVPVKPAGGCKWYGEGEPKIEYELYLMRTNFPKSLTKELALTWFRSEREHY